MQKTTEALLNSFQEKWPQIMKPLPMLRFIEQYDPEDTSESATSQPYAFVADKVETCKLSLDVCETMNDGVSSGSWDALMELKDRIAPNEKLGWWIVYNGDELRADSSSRGGESRASAGTAGTAGTDQVWDFKSNYTYFILQQADRTEETDGSGKKSQGNKLKRLLSR